MSSSSSSRVGGIYSYSCLCGGGWCPWCACGAGARPLVHVLAVQACVRCVRGDGHAGAHRAGGHLGRLQVLGCRLVSMVCLEVALLQE